MSPSARSETGTPENRAEHAPILAIEHNAGASDAAGEGVVATLDANPRTGERNAPHSETLCGRGAERQRARKTQINLQTDGSIVDLRVDNGRSGLQRNGLLSPRRPGQTSNHRAQDEE